jgi:DNA-binding GntR family transcriptional regulator
MNPLQANKALMEFLGIDPNSNVTQIEVFATPDKFPTVIVTRLIIDPIWKTEARMFELVPYEHFL